MFSSWTLRKSYGGLLIGYVSSSDIEEFTSEVVFTVTAPFNLLREFLPLVRKSETKKALFVTSILGSIQIAPNLPNLMNAYSVARAALNM
jgi:NAD(P)-dependent dehydrogenase (short-subunit alcohol dehydrogenase family)